MTPRRCVRIALFLQFWVLPTVSASRQPLLTGFEMPDLHHNDSETVHAVHGYDEVASDSMPRSGSLAETKVEVEIAPWQRVSVSGTSARALLEAFLRGKHIDGMPLKTAQKGLIKQGFLEDVVVDAATAGDSTHFEVSKDGSGTILVGKDIAAHVTSRYKLQFAILNVPETGSASMKLLIPEVKVFIPSAGTGAGYCEFAEGMDFRVDEAISDNRFLTPFVAPMLRKNMIGLRKEMVVAAQAPLCDVLLKPNTNMLLTSTNPATPVGTADLLFILLPIALVLAVLGGIFYLIYSCGYARGAQKPDSSQSSFGSQGGQAGSYNQRAPQPPAPRPPYF